MQWYAGSPQSFRLAPARTATWTGRDRSGDLVVGEDAEVDHGARWTAINHLVNLFAFILNPLRNLLK
jgi:hypothetical protein